jgi:hypothetical protein
VLWPVGILDLSLSLMPVGILFFENNPKTAAILGSALFLVACPTRGHLWVLLKCILKELKSIFALF